MSNTQRAKTNPAFTLPEAQRLGLADKATYTRVLPLYQIARQQGCGAGIEPSANVLQKLVHSYSPDVQSEILTASKRLVDPKIQILSERLRQILANLEAMRANSGKITSTETGTHYTEQEAVNKAYEHDAKIHEDELGGDRHHRRVAPWVRWLRSWITWLEALGLAVFTATALNINFLDPVADFSGWLLAVVMVVVVLAFQAPLVKRSGEAYNHYREALAEGQSFPAEDAKRRALHNGLGAAVFSGVVTFALIERFVTITDITDPFIYWLMIALCVVTGIGMPLFAWIGHAWDGSRVSRERDDLTAALDESLARHNGLLNTINVENTRFIDTRIELSERVIPTIVSSTAGHVDNARKAYAFLRIQLGGLTTKPPYCERKAPATPADLWYVHTDIPETDPIHLSALESRANEIISLDQERRQATATVAQLDAHPWAGENPTVAASEVEQAD